MKTAAEVLGVGAGRPRLRVLVADDDENVRGLLRRALEMGGDMEVVGEATDGAEAIELSERLHPGAVVSDLRMPVLNGDEVLRRVRSRLPGTVLVLCSARPDPDSIEAAGADGVVDKMEPDWTLQVGNLLLQEAWRLGPPGWPQWERRGEERAPA